MTSVPDIVPMLAAGKHRSPRSGGCFMEIASYLAGERWSDHPKCTDPALAELARCVNDVMPEGARSRLSPMIPSVIGTGGRAETVRTRLAALVVRDAALVALPLVTVAARPIACALLVAERVLGESTDDAAAALATRPNASEFARQFLQSNPDRWRDPRTYLSRAVPRAVRCAVRAVGDEVPETPDVLITLLATAIDTVRAACGLVDSYGVSEQQWRSACQLVGAAPAEKRWGS